MRQSFSNIINPYQTTYSFQGQERDDEVKGAGNSYTTEFRQLDPRIGRWLSLDPLMRNFPWQSAYSSFNSNPILIIDPKGLDGIVSVDKDKKTINVQVNFYYDKSNEDYKKYGITEDFINKSTGKLYKSDINKFHESGFESKNGSSIKIDGKDWTINYNINFIGLESLDAVKNKLNEDKTANSFQFINDLQFNGKPTSGLWNANTRTLSIGSLRRDDGSTLIHEFGHSIGLPHSTEIPNTSHFGCIHDCPEQVNHNGNNDEYGSMMSYALYREIEYAELKISVLSSVRLADSVQDKFVKIHLKGSDEWKPEILK